MSYVAAVLADSPLIFWPLTDPSGTTAEDVSGNARDGTIVGSPSLASSPVMPGGRNVWHSAFSGGDYVYRSYELAWTPSGTDDWLYEAWIKLSTANTLASSYETLLNLDNNASGDGVDLYVPSNPGGAINPGSLRIWVGGVVLQSTAAQNPSGASLYDGKPHHLWVERRSGTVGLYVDDTLVTSSGAMGSVNTRSGFFGVGCEGIWPGGGLTYLNEYSIGNPMGYVAWWKGTIPAASRRGVHFREGRRQGVLLGHGGFGG